MNPAVTPFVLKQGATLAKAGLKEDAAAVNEKGSARKKANAAAPEDLPSFASILSGTMAKADGNGPIKSERVSALLQAKAQVQTKGAGAEVAGKVRNRAGLEGKRSTENALEPGTEARKRVVAEKVSKAGGRPEGLQEGLKEAQKPGGEEATAAKATESILKSGKKFDRAVKAAAEPSERASASTPESGKGTAVEATNVRSRRAALTAAVREDRATPKLDASAILLDRVQNIKSPKATLTGVSGFTQPKAKPEKASPQADNAHSKEAGASRGQKKTEAARAETSRTDGTNLKDRAEGAKVPVAEGRSAAADGTGRQEDRFANVLQTRSESVTGRVMENPGPLRPQVIIPQIVEGAGSVLRGGSGRVVITLHPPQLGTLDMDIRVRENKVSLVMLADNHEVKQVLESSLVHLKNALGDHGLQIDRVDVLVQDRAGSEFAGMLHERGTSPEGRAQPEGGGPSARGAKADPVEVRRNPDTDESRLVNVFA